MSTEEIKEEIADEVKPVLFKDTVKKCYKKYAHLTVDERNAILKQQQKDAMRRYYLKNKASRIEKQKAYRLSLKVIKEPKSSVADE